MGYGEPSRVESTLLGNDMVVVVYGCGKVVPASLGKDGGVD